MPPCCIFSRLALTARGATQTYCMARMQRVPGDEADVKILALDEVLSLAVMQERGGAMALF